MDWSGAGLVSEMVEEAEKWVFSYPFLSCFSDSRIHVEYLDKLKYEC